MKRYKYSWRKLFEDFRRTYPEVRKDIYFWEPWEFSTIRLWFKDGRLATYNDYDREIKFLDGSWIRDEPTRRERRHEMHEQNMRVFSENMKRLMGERKITQKEIADTLDISKQSVSDYVNGKRYPNKELRFRIAFILGVKSDWMIGEHKEVE